MNDINFALVEEKRPPMYTAMKYWGKKPHNIWGKYIENYTSKGDFILDPFSGSAVAAFEAVKSGRKAFAFDVNPLTAFLIDVYSTEFKKEIFINSVNRIIEKVKNDTIYQKLFIYECPKCKNKSAIIQHTKWDGGKIYEVGIVCPCCKSRNLVKDTSIKIDEIKAIENYKIPFWYPTDKFYNSPSFSDSFIRNIGGNGFDSIWTKRNLYVLSMIFNEILEEKNENIKKQLLFGFIQSLHLSSKMCVPRRENANRSFSTSWGRAAYICSKRQMEMNPLLLFQNNCIGKQSVQSALMSVTTHIGKIPITHQISKNNLNFPENCDIVYGTVDVKKLTEFIKEKSISFIITDPPYGGLVQYGDLSLVWLVWLKKYNPSYAPIIEDEITIKKGLKDTQTYNTEFTQGIKNLYKVLKDDGKIVFTFHNKDLGIWNAFLRSISESGFQIEKVIHQQNRRTGESNVANPYGTSASDFYIRCSKSNYVKNIKTSKEEFENFIVDRAVKIIEARSEPTPYQILFNGLLAEISKAGFELIEFDSNLQKILNKHIGTVFEIIKTNKAYGNMWWISDKNISDSKATSLTHRVSKTIENLFEIKDNYTFDEILAEIFIAYPNGLTPDIKNIEKYISKIAVRSGNKWVKKKE